MEYKLVACGGTFDLFHKGHKEFLQFVLGNGEKAIIGVTSDKYILKNKSEQNIEPFEVRKQAVIEYLTNINELNRVTIVPLDDPYGPPITDEYPVEAIVVTDDTKKGGEKINEIRQSNGLSVLPIISTELVIGEDGGFISSQRIRDGVINREGKLYVYDAWFTQTFKLPNHLREQLQKPIGELIPNFEEWIKENKIDGARTATVGDVVTSFCNNNSVNQQISIFDFVVEREKKYQSYKELGFNLPEEEIITIQNPAGTISGKVFEVLKSIFIEKLNKSIMIKVEGEEDLLVIPLVLTAPLGLTILYGQPKQGVVNVVVTEEKKKEINEILSQFERN